MTKITKVTKVTRFTRLTRLTKSFRWGGGGVFVYYRKPWSMSTHGLPYDRFATIPTRSPTHIISTTMPSLLYRNMGMNGQGSKPTRQPDRQTDRHLSLSNRN